MRSIIVADLELISLFHAIVPSFSSQQTLVSESFSITPRTFAVADCFILSILLFIMKGQYFTVGFFRVANVEYLCY